MEDTQNYSFIDGRLMSSRLLSEHAELKPLKRKADTEYEINAKTNSEFQIGFNDPKNPKKFMVGIDYEIFLTIKGTNESLLKYKVKFACDFKLVKWIGFTSWHELPEEAISPYFSFVHHIAKSWAENSFTRMNLRNIKLPYFDLDTPVDLLRM